MPSSPPCSSEPSASLSSFVCLPLQRPKRIRGGAYGDFSGTGESDLVLVKDGSLELHTLQHADGKGDMSLSFSTDEPFDTRGFRTVFVSLQTTTKNGERASSSSESQPSSSGSCSVPRRSFLIHVTKEGRINAFQLTGRNRDQLQQTQQHRHLSWTRCTPSDFVLPRSSGWSLHAARDSGAPGGVFVAYNVWARTHVLKLQRVQTGSQETQDVEPGSFAYEIVRVLNEEATVLKEADPDFDRKYYEKTEIKDGMRLHNAMLSLDPSSMLRDYRCYHCDAVFVGGDRNRSFRGVQRDEEQERKTKHDGRETTAIHRDGIKDGNDKAGEREGLEDIKNLQPTTTTKPIPSDTKPTGRLTIAYVHPGVNKGYPRPFTGQSGHSNCLWLTCFVSNGLNGDGFISCSARLPSSVGDKNSVLECLDCKRITLSPDGQRLFIFTTKGILLIDISESLPGMRWREEVKGPFQEDKDAIVQAMNREFVAIMSEDVKTGEECDQVSKGKEGKEEDSGRRAGGDDSVSPTRQRNQSIEGDADVEGEQGVIDSNSTPSPTLSASPPAYMLLDEVKMDGGEHEEREEDEDKEGSKSGDSEQEDSEAWDTVDNRGAEQGAEKPLDPRCLDYPKGWSGKKAPSGLHWTGCERLLVFSPGGGVMVLTIPDDGEKGNEGKARLQYFPNYEPAECVIPLVQGTLLVAGHRHTPSFLYSLSNVKQSALPLTNLRPTNLGIWPIHDVHIVPQKGTGSQISLVQNVGGRFREFSTNLRVEFEASVVIKKEKNAVSTETKKESETSVAPSWVTSVAAVHSFSKGIVVSFPTATRVLGLDLSDITSTYCPSVDASIKTLLFSESPLNRRIIVHANANGIYVAEGSSLIAWWKPRDSMEIKEHISSMTAIVTAAAVSWEPIKTRTGPSKTGTVGKPGGLTAIVGLPGAVVLLQMNPGSRAMVLKDVHRVRGTVTCLGFHREFFAVATDTEEAKLFRIQPNVGVGLVEEWDLKAFRKGIHEDQYLSYGGEQRSPVGGLAVPESIAFLEPYDREGESGERGPEAFAYVFLGLRNGILLEVNLNLAKMSKGQRTRSRPRARRLGIDPVRLSPIALNSEKYRERSFVVAMTAGEAFAIHTRHRILRVTVQRLALNHLVACSSFAGKLMFITRSNIHIGIIPELMLSNPFKRQKSFAPSTSSQPPKILPKRVHFVERLGLTAYVAPSARGHHHSDYSHPNQGPTSSTEGTKKNTDRSASWQLLIAGNRQSLAIQSVLDTDDGGRGEPQKGEILCSIPLAEAMGGGREEKKEIKTSDIARGLSSEPIVCVWDHFPNFLERKRRGLEMLRKESSEEATKQDSLSNNACVGSSRKRKISSACRLHGVESSQLTMEAKGQEQKNEKDGCDRNHLYYRFTSNSKLKITGKATDIGSRPKINNAETGPHPRAEIQGRARHISRLGRFNRRRIMRKRRVMRGRSVRPRNPIDAENEGSDADFAEESFCRNGDSEDQKSPFFQSDERKHLGDQKVPDVTQLDEGEFLRETKWANEKLASRMEEMKMRTYENFDTRVSIVRPGMCSMWISESEIRDHLEFELRRPEWSLRHGSDSEDDDEDEEVEEDEEEEQKQEEEKEEQIVVGGQKLDTVEAKSKKAESIDASVIQGTDIRNERTSGSLRNRTKDAMDIDQPTSSPSGLDSRAKQGTGGCTVIATRGLYICVASEVENASETNVVFKGRLQIFRIKVTRSDEDKKLGVRLELTAEARLLHPPTRVVPFQRDKLLVVYDRTVVMLGLNKSLDSIRAFGNGTMVRDKILDLKTKENTVMVLGERDGAFIFKVGGSNYSFSLEKLDPYSRMGDNVAMMDTREFSVSDKHGGIALLNSEISPSCHNAGEEDYDITSYTSTYLRERCYFRLPSRCTSIGFGSVSFTSSRYLYRTRISADIDDKALALKPLFASTVSGSLYLLLPIHTIQAVSLHAIEGKMIEEAGARGVELPSRSSRTNKGHNVIDGHLVLRFLDMPLRSKKRLIGNNEDNLRVIEEAIYGVINRGCYVEFLHAENLGD